MNNKWKKIISAALCVSLLAAGAGVTTFAKNDPKDTKVKNEKTVDTKEEVKTEKKETKTNEPDDLYVFTDANGSVKKIVSSGEEEVTKLPVNIKFTYKLNGKEIKPEDLAGKSGHVVIRVDYTNDCKKSATIEEKKEELYVPYLMLTGMIMDNNIFSNITISNGKILDDGDRSIVAGIALPGIQKDLELDKEDIEIPDYIEVEADATEFKLMETMTVATNELFDDLDTSKFDSIDGLKDSMKELTDGMDQLLNGSGQLKDGLNTLNDKTGELSGGVGKLVSGAGDLNNGAAALNQGADQVVNGAQQLSAGLSTLNLNNGALKDGAAQIFQTMLATGQEQLTAAGLSVGTLTIDNYSGVLDGVIASLDATAVYQQALAMVQSKVEANRPVIVEAVTAAVNDQVREQVQTVIAEEVKSQVTAAVNDQVEEAVILQVTTAIGQPMTKEQYNAALGAGMIPEEVSAKVQETIAAQMESQEIQGKISQLTQAKLAGDDIKQLTEAKIAEQMQSQAIQDIIAQNTEIQVQQKISEAMASEEVQSQLNAASEGSKSVIKLKAMLDGYNSFYLGLVTYVNGVEAANNGAATLVNGLGTLKDGTSKLVSGTNELKNGVLQFSNAVPALTDGVTQLKDGSVKLSDGLNDFNEKGIQKLVDAVDGDLSTLSARLKAMVNVSKDEEKPVKILYRTDKIGE